MKRETMKKEIRFSHGTFWRYSFWRRPCICPTQPGVWGAEKRDREGANGKWKQQSGSDLLWQTVVMKSGKGGESLLIQCMNISLLGSKWCNAVQTFNCIPEWMHEKQGDYSLRNQHWDRVTPTGRTGTSILKKNMALSTATVYFY